LEKAAGDERVFIPGLADGAIPVTVGGHGAARPEGVIHRCVFYLLHPSLPYNALSLSVNLPNPTINQRALGCCLPLLALGRRRSTKIMAFKLNPFVLHPRLTPHLSGRLATCFATRARPESSATVESRLALILRVRSVSTSRPKDADDVKTIPHGE
jgi:hypothetical protein